MKTIVLIGAGQLGSRHLQALAKLDFSVNIQIVDPFAASLENAKIRFEEMPLNLNIKSINYFSSINKISKSIDLAIIATNANVRATVVTDLLEVCEVKNLILEKVLFQKPNDYKSIDELLKRKNVKTWVNHPFRTYPFYKNLKELLSGSKQISYQLQGGDWGLGCNSLHYIDLVAYLTGQNEYSINSERLNLISKPSKRKDFIEFTGTLSGSFGPHSFDIFCHDQSSPLSVMICSDNFNILIDEGNGWIRISKKEEGWVWKEENLKLVHYQSELTNIVATEILNTGKCDLPTYQVAMQIHLPFINTLIHHLNKTEQKTFNYCPIT